MSTDPTDDLISQLLPFSPWLQFHSLVFDPTTQHVNVTLGSYPQAATCPQCGIPSGSLHSGYTRTVADLPWADWRVCLTLQVRKLRCKHTDCRQKIFCERLSQLVAPWARKSDRLRAQQQQIALAVGGRAGSRLSQRLDRPASRHTLLRAVRAMPLPTGPTPHALGVDDFAKRKGQHYGTVLVDLETHRPVELLADREADTLAQWLAAHPGVAILSRDRSSAYADGARRGAPEALQVADRFHLLRNLAEVLIALFTRHQTALQQATGGRNTPALPAPLQDTVASPPTVDTPAIPAPAPMTVPALPTTALARARREQHLNDYQRARELYQQGWTLQAIGRHLGLKRQRLRRYIHSSSFPDRRRPVSILDPYKPHLLQRWNSGCRTGTVLYQEIQQQGYAGSRSNVFAYIRRLRDAQGLPRRSRALQPVPPLSDPQLATLTPRQAAWLILRRPDRRDTKDKTHTNSYL